MLSDVISKGTGLIAALDASFMTRSAKKTDGPGNLWHGCSARPEQGLELSLLSVIDLQSNTAYALNAKQTIDEADKTRVVPFGVQVVKLAKNILEPGITCLVVDADYFKEKFVSAIVGTGPQIVGKLRNDADLLWLYSGPYSGKGRPKIYDGKVKTEKDLHSFDYIVLIQKCGRSRMAGAQA